MNEVGEGAIMSENESETNAPSGTLAAVCLSKKKGQQKIEVERGTLVAGHGLAGDAHAGTWHRQVSLLDDADVDQMRAKGLTLAAGAFGENLVIDGLNLEGLPLGTRLRVGPEAVVQITQRGKECHTRCAIYHQAGDCIMPRLGLFARVRKGGVATPGDPVVLDPAYNRIRLAVITLSDKGAAGQRKDTGGELALTLLQRPLEAELVTRTLLPDDRDTIGAELQRLCDEDVCDLVVTTGGTGLAPRDVTPEATLDVADREVPGLSEAMRTAGLAKTPRAMLSRGVCAMRGQSLIINLSGSPKAVQEQLDAILPALPHAIEVASGVPQECGAEATGA